MPNTPTQKVVSKKHLARLEKERIQRRNLIIGAAVVAILVLGLVGYGLLDQYVFKLIRPIATVNGQQIKVKDFQARVRFARWQTVQQYSQYFQYYQLFSSSPEYAAQFQQNLLTLQSKLNDTTGFANTALDDMIDDILIQEEATKRNITVTNEEVEKNLQENFGYYANGTPTTAPTETPASTSTLSATQIALVPPTATETITTTPAGSATPTVTETPGITETPTAGPSPTITPTEGPTATATPYTFQGYQTEVSSFTSKNLKPIDFTEAQLHDFIYKSLLRKKVSDAITADVKPYQEEVWARHILVADEVTAAAVADRLKKGEDFATVAKEVSIDTGTKDKGGDLGWFSRDAMVTDFSTVAFSLGIGEISGPVKTQYGYHIIQVLGHEDRPVDATTLSKLKSNAFQEWLDKANSSAKITRRTDITDLVPVEPTIPANEQIDASAANSGLSVLPTEAPTAAGTPAPATTTEAQPSVTPKP